MVQIRLNDVIQYHLDQVGEVAGYLWDKGWAEWNAGNVSIVFPDAEQIIPERLDDFRYVSAMHLPAESAGRILYVSGTGVRLRNLRNPQQGGCMIRIDDRAAGYYILWGGRHMKEFRPTNEFTAHLKVHLDVMDRAGSSRAILHTHPTELIALSHHPKHGRDGRGFTQMLWRMMPEIRVLLARGIGLMDYQMPGSEQLADMTVEFLRRHDVVVWKKHGVIAAGNDLTHAFDLIDVANKGAMIFLNCLAAGYSPEGLTDRELEELVQAYL